MGKSDEFLSPWWQFFVKPVGDVALLGFTNNKLFPGDLYDRSLGNWDINSDWNLNKKYDTIVCLRCAYFAKDPESFFKKCHDNLKPGGKIYIDWGLGDHWRFENYKIGWVKDGEHEHAYGEDNLLWSTVWDDAFLQDENFIKFSENVKAHGYEDTKAAIFDEVPSILMLDQVNKYFNTKYNLKTLWSDQPQLYILLSGEKK